MHDKLSTYRHTIESRYICPDLTPAQAHGINAEDIECWLLYGHVRAAEARQLVIYNDYCKARHTVKAALDKGGDE